MRWRRDSTDDISFIGYFRPKATGRFIQSGSRSSQISGVIKVPRFRFILALAVPSLVWIISVAALIGRIAGLFHDGSIFGFLGGALSMTALAAGMIGAATSSIRRNTQELLTWLKELATRAGDQPTLSSAPVSVPIRRDWVPPDAALTCGDNGPVSDDVPQGMPSYSDYENTYTSWPLVIHGR